MPGPIERELTRLCRLSTLAVACRAFGDAALVTGLVLGSAAVTLRIAGHAVSPSPQWWWALAMPIGWSVARVARARPTRDLCAAHLDRRYALGGLLLTGLERATTGWQERLAGAIRDAAAARPRLRPWRALGRTAAGAVFLGGVALLPPPDPHGVDPRSRALVAAVDDLGEKVEVATLAGSLPSARAEELEARVRELEERLADGQAVSWSDVDALRERLAHEQGVQAGGLAATRAGARALAQQARDADSLEALDSEALGELAQWAERAAALGLHAELPEDLRAALEALAQAAEAGGGNLDLEGLGLDAEQLRKLAAALDGAALQRLAHAAARLPADQLGDLRALLEGEGLGGTGAGALPSAQGGDGEFDPTPGPDGDGAPGRGGVNRGRGDAALDGTHTMDVDTAALRAERLPEGAAIPEQWQRLGVSRAEPEAAPERPTGATGGAVEIDPGAMAWRRRLAPHQQEVVRRFFSDNDGRPR